MSCCIPLLSLCCNLPPTCKSSPTFSVWPRSSVGRVTVDLMWRSWVRFRRIFSLPCAVPWFPLLGLMPSGSFMGFTWHFNLHLRVNSKLKTAFLYCTGLHCVALSLCFVLLFPILLCFIFIMFHFVWVNITQFEFWYKLLVQQFATSNNLLLPKIIFYYFIKVSQIIFIVYLAFSFEIQEKTRWVCTFWGYVCHVRNIGFFGNFCTVNNIVIIHMSESSLKIE